MTTQTRKGRAGGLNDFNIVHDILVTSSAGALGDLATPGLHLDGIVKFTGGERKRMEKTVIGLGEIFRDQPGRSVTVVASRDGAMTRLDPAVEMILHNVTVGAGSWIVAKIGRALGINKSIAGDSHRGAKRESDQEAEESGRSTRGI